MAMRRQRSNPRVALGRRIIDALARQRKPVPLARLASLIDVGENDEEFLHAVATLRAEGSIYAQDGDRYGSAVGIGAHVGTISVNPAGFGFVKPEGGGTDIHVPERRINGAIDGDRVLVAPLRSRSDRGPAGQVLGVVERPSRRLVGLLHRGPGFAWIHPDQRTLPDIQLLGPVPETAREGEKIVAAIEPVTLVTTIPLARFERVLGAPGAPWVDIEGIISAYNLRDGYPSEAVREAERRSPAVTGDDLGGRKDLRDRDIVTIDPFDAADLDDAIGLDHDERGRPVVGIHIADVSHYVERSGHIDREAEIRGTSVYLPGRVLHMLPKALSERLCSLRPDGDRLTVSVFVTLDKNGDPVNVEIARSVIRSRAQLSYEQVQAVLDGAAEPANPARPFEQTLREIAAIAAKLTEKRIAAGALDFDLPEIKVEVDPDGRVVSLRKRERLESHRLIEELMLLANRTIAHHLAANGYGILYRVHGGPDPAKLGEIAFLAAASGHPIGAGGSVTVRELQALIAGVKGDPIAPVLQTLIIRSMPKAVYQPENIGHFGLATDEYAHFTSPIRRYPDLIVHRQLARLLAGEPSIYDEDDLVRLGRSTSEAEKVADDAEREAVRAKQVEYLAEHLGEEFDGTISGVQKFGIFVALADSLAEGFISANELPEDEYRYDQARLSLVGRHNRAAFHFGDPVRVQIGRVDMGMRRVDFVLVDAPASRRRRRTEGAAHAAEPKKPERRTRKRERPGHRKARTPSRRSR